MVTVTPGSAPPDESTTNPPMDPRDSCAPSRGDPKTRTQPRTASVTCVTRVMHPPLKVPGSRLSSRQTHALDTSVLLLGLTFSGRAYTVLNRTTIISPQPRTGAQPGRAARCSYDE